MRLKGNSLLKKAIVKLSKDYLAMVSLFIVFSAAFISFFAYGLAVDKTKDAALQNLVLKYKPIAYETQILKLPLQNYSEQKGFAPFFFGKEIDFEEIAVEEVQLKNDSLYYKPYIGEELEAEVKKIPISVFTEKGIEKENILKNFLSLKKFFLGTDSFGRDFYSRLIIGTRISFFVGFVAVAISVTIGVIVGALGGYYRGRIDAIVMWVINVVWSIPTLLLVMAITLAIGKGYWQIFLAVGLTMWVEVARVVRGQFLSYREKEFVEAARALGYSDLRIIFKEILPNVVAPVIVISAANFAAAILVESGLSFLGIGAQPPTPSWGNIIKEHYSHIILDQQHLAILPGLCILVLVLAFNIFGNKLRDALDNKNI
ncbi:Glutathione transport system permease protein gsiD [Candidatus Ornithobacterium hominis]|uniref:Glutathione transport system permease protein gsiD n=1 Tax=Candidatus Ornithobacterium hominis TaxID=2497989 RepID=A0A383TX54_9FLAO|nr:ABC transporter permease [Candidatus Ornithobacterium hominis]MCT7904476.1 ABC transporter permease [Candidatus Ornithobacterium hominis]SZD71373.1 Glutathione transport system permease protein gsiD [Candidatus Ornithobacterium hominis]